MHRIPVLVLFLFCASLTRPATGRLAAEPAATVSALQVPPALPRDTVPDEPPRRKRRPSMVGYTADATIGTQVRLRYDAGFGTDSPDRAEFFYAKCGCYRDLAGDPAYDADAPGPGPGIVTDLDFQQLFLFAEYSPHDRVSLFAELPVRWLQPQSFVHGAGSFDDQSGLSDVRAGVKVAVLDSPDRLVSLQVQATAPTGAASRGLGTDHWSVEPLLLFNQIVSDRAQLEGHLGMVIPVDGSAGVPTTADDEFAGDIIAYGIGPSLQLYRSGAVQFVPVLELVGWHILDGYQTAVGEEASAEGINIANLKLGGRFIYREASSVYVGYGQALTDSAWYEQVVRVEYRHTF